MTLEHFFHNNKFPLYELHQKLAKWENFPKIKTLIGIGIILIFEYHNAI
jgi:hypothetical protein